MLKRLPEGILASELRTRGEDIEKMESMIIDEVVEQLSTMPINLQRQVLDFVHSLRMPAAHGVPGTSLLRFAAFIPTDDLSTMQMAIEADCERVDTDAW